MIRNKTFIAMGAVLAIAAAGAAQAATQDGRIAVTLTIDDTSTVSDLTEEQLRVLLADSGFDDRAIDKAVKAGLKDGKLVLQGKSDKAAAAATSQPKLGK